MDLGGDILYRKGKDNTQYGISPLERMGRKKYDNWRENHKNSILGKNNPNYKNSKLKEIYKKDKKLAKEKQSRKGIKNGMCKKVKMYDINNNTIKEFNYIGLCCKYLEENNIVKNKKSAYSQIYLSNKNNKSYKGYYFKY